MVGDLVRQTQKSIARDYQVAKYYVWNIGMAQEHTMDSLLSTRLRSGEPRIRDLET
jgi:hypothetical protein